MKNNILLIISIMLFAFILIWRPIPCFLWSYVLFFLHSLIHSDEFLNRAVELVFTQLFHAPQLPLQRWRSHRHPPLITLRLNSPVTLLLRHRNRLSLRRRHSRATTRRGSGGLSNRPDSFLENRRRWTTNSGGDFFVGRINGPRLFLRCGYDEARLVEGVFGGTNVVGECE